VLTAVIFRAPSLQGAWYVYEGLASFPDLRLTGSHPGLLAAFCALVVPPSHHAVSRMMGLPRAALAYAAAALVTYCLLEIGQGAPVNFIYFQF
jgi:hypothetical protein